MRTAPLVTKHVLRMQPGAGVAVFPSETMPQAWLDHSTASVGVLCRSGTTHWWGWGSSHTHLWCVSRAQNSFWST